MHLLKAYEIPDEKDYVYKDGQHIGFKRYDVGDGGYTYGYGHG